MAQSKFYVRHWLEPAIATQDLPALNRSFFARPAEVVAPELIGCLLVKRSPTGEPLWGVIVETEAYAQSEPACHGHHRRSPSNETIFGPPGRFYVYLTYGIHHCVNVVTDRSDWASGVLLRAVALPGLPERTAAGPGLLARCFGLGRQHDRLESAVASGYWLAPRPAELGDWLRQEQHSGGAPIRQTLRIGISQGQELPWRWYLRASRSVSRRAPGDRPPRQDRLAALLESWAEAGGASTVGPFDGSRTP